MLKITHILLISVKHSLVSRYIYIASYIRNSYLINLIILKKCFQKWWTIFGIFENKIFPAIQFVYIHMTWIMVYDNNCSYVCTLSSSSYIILFISVLAIR